MPLNKFQTDFKELMLRPRAELSVENEAVTNTLISDHIHANDRLSIYHNNIIGSLSNVLCSTFPMIENLVGTNFLKEMARQFIFKNPPNSACLHHYGEGFDAFIKEYEPAANLPYLADVATLEFALNHAYYAQDDAPLPADALAQIPPESLAKTLLSPRASATLITSSYPLTDLRAFCLNDGEAPELSAPTDCRLLIYRPKLEVKIIPLTKDEYAFLSNLQQGTPLGAALENVTDTYTTFDFAAFLQKHIALETFCATHPNENKAKR